MVINCRCFSLFKKGAAYKCFCTKLRLNLIRKDAMKHGEIPKYDNKCRHLSETEIQEKIAAKTPYVIRFKVRVYFMFKIHFFCTCVRYESNECYLVFMYIRPKKRNSVFRVTLMKKLGRYGFFFILSHFFLHES